MLELNWKHSSGKLQGELSQEPYSIKRELHKLSKFYKIAENLALCYLIELLPKLSGERTHFCLSLIKGKLRTISYIERLSLFRSLIFHPHSQHVDVRNSVSSLPTFFFYSENMVNYLPHTHSELHDCYFSRRLSFDHNHLWLGFSSLGENLFKINSCVSPICVCGLNQWNTFSCTAHCMPPNVMSSLPLPLIMWDMVIEVAIQGN